MSMNINVSVSSLNNVDALCPQNVESPLSVSIEDQYDFKTELIDNFSNKFVNSLAKSGVKFALTAALTAVNASGVDKGIVSYVIMPIVEALLQYSSPVLAESLGGSEYSFEDGDKYFGVTLAGVATPTMAKRLTSRFENYVREYTTSNIDNETFNTLIGKVHEANVQCGSTAEIAMRTLKSARIEFVSSLGSAFLVDFVVSLGSNLVKGLVQSSIDNTEITFASTKESLKLGETLLKSSIKVVCATAGSIIGGEAGKAVGSAVGSFLAEFAVDAFDNNQTACAIAGAAVLIGAAAGGIAILAITTAPLLVAGAVVAAAAAAFFLCLGIYKIIVS